MKKHFTSDDLPLAQILEEASTGTLQLPDFQRGWVWDDNHIRSLLASISLSYPIGAVMTLATGNPKVRFKARLLEGVQLQNSPEPDVLLLDGQQRLTSLFQALKSHFPVTTQDSRDKEMRCYYYVNINASLNSSLDREEEVIVAIPEDRKIRSNFGREVDMDISTRDLEISKEMFPLNIIFDSSETMAWQILYLQTGPGEQGDRVSKWEKFQQAIVNPFIQYHVPIIKLIKSTPKEAVCQVFEKVNTQGVTLSVFELLTATYAADDFELRKDWDARRNRLAQHELLKGVEGKSFLQIVTLLATYDRRHTHRQRFPNDDAIPAVSCQRKDVLRLSLTDYKKWADRAEKGLMKSVPFLYNNRVFKSGNLPYASQLLPLGAILGRLEDQADSYSSQQRLTQWFWCGILGEMYGSAAESRFANDIEDCIAWILNQSDDQLPRTIQQAQFQADRLLSLRTRNSAAYKGLHALQMKQGARDFRTGQLIDVHAYMEDAIDIHHIFPANWCYSNEIEGKIYNSIINKTAIDAHTNRRIGGNAPSSYLARLESNDGIEPQKLDGLLRTHNIDPVTLRRDDFGEFFNQRFESMLRLVEDAMGKPVNRSPDRDESPFAENTGSSSEVVRSIIENGESNVVEFKSTALLNLHTKSKDYQISWAIIKTLAAFMNSNGGTLIVGVDDSGHPIGIEQDYPFVKDKSRDGWERWLTDTVKNALGAIAILEMQVRFENLEEFVLARIDVRPSPKPVFATPTGKSGEMFFVRLNNTTRELTGKDLLDYRSKNWNY